MVIIYLYSLIKRLLFTELCDLPFDIYENVFSYLSASDLKNLLLTCKQLNFAVSNSKQMYKLPLVLKDQVDITDVFIKRNYTNFVISFATFADFKRICRNFIRIYWDQVQNITFECFPELFFHFPNLKSVKVRNYPTRTAQLMSLKPAITKYQKTITSLTIENSSFWVRND